MPNPYIDDCAGAEKRVRRTRNLPCAFGPCSCATCCLAQAGAHSQPGGQYCRAADVLVASVTAWALWFGTVKVGGTQVPLHPVLASGSICMSAMQAASFEALYSASRACTCKRPGCIMNAPVNLDDIVLAEMLWRRSSPCSP